MRTVSLVLAALVSAGHGSRWQRTQHGADEMTNPMQALATLLLAGDPSAAWQGIPAQPGRISGRRSLAAAPAKPRASPTSMGLAVGDTFPADALAQWGISGKNSVVFFFGADDAPSCSKQLAAFDAALPQFEEAGISVVGVRNPSGAKGSETAVKLVVDEDDAVRNEIGIEKDLFGLLGGRETYVLDKKGTVVEVYNTQFDPESHIQVALDSIEKLPKDKNPFAEFLDNLR